MSKELNIIEASNMPVGTELKVVFKDKFKATEDNIITVAPSIGGNNLIWKSDKADVTAGQLLINAKFIPVTKPVSFMEAVKSMKKVRVDISDLNHYPGSSIKILNNFMYLSEILTALVNNVDYAWVWEVIEKGKWYIEEE